MKSLSFFASLFFILLLGLYGCGGTPGSTSSGGGGGTGSSSPSGVDPDISAADTTKSSPSASVSKSANSEEAPLSVAKAMGNAVGDDSIAGCEANQLKDEGKRMSKQVAVFNCYIDTAESSIPDFTCQTSDFSHYQFSVSGGGPAGGDGFSMKIRCKNPSGTRTVHICEDNKQTESFTFTTATTTRTVTYAMKHHFTSAADGGEDDDFCDLNNDDSVSDAERATCRTNGSFDEWGQMNGTVVYDAAATGVVDSISELDSVNVAGIFNGNFGNGSLTFIYDEDGGVSSTQMNSVLGCFVSSFGAGDAGTGCMFSEFNATQGSSKFTFSGTMPCIPGLPTHLSGCHCPLPLSDSCDPGTKFATQACRVANPAASCYCLQTSNTNSCAISENDTEHFTIQTGSNGKLQFKMASTSDFATSVSAKTLPTAPDTLTKSFGSEAWDCNGPADGSGFKPITVNEETVFATCFAKEEEAFKNEDHDSCFQDMGESHIVEGEAAKASLSLPE